MVCQILLKARLNLLRKFYKNMENKQVAKKIINNKFYSTDNAKRVGENLGIVGLYLTEKGQWFWVDANHVIDLWTEQQAKEHLSYKPELYIKYFGEVEEG